MASPGKADSDSVHLVWRADYERHFAHLGETHQWVSDVDTDGTTISGFAMYSSELGQWRSTYPVLTKAGLANFDEAMAASIFGDHEDSPAAKRSRGSDTAQPGAAGAASSTALVPVPALALPRSSTLQFLQSHPSSPRSSPDSSSRPKGKKGKKKKGKKGKKDKRGKKEKCQKSQKNKQSRKLKTTCVSAESGDGASDSSSSDARGGAHGVRKTCLNAEKNIKKVIRSAEQFRSMEDEEDLKKSTCTKLFKEPVTLINQKLKDLAPPVTLPGNYSTLRVDLTAASGFGTQLYDFSLPVIQYYNNRRSAESWGKIKAVLDSPKWQTPFVFSGARWIPSEFAPRFIRKDICVMECENDISSDLHHKVWTRMFEFFNSSKDQSRIDGMTSFADEVCAKIAELPTNAKFLLALHEFVRRACPFLGDHSSPQPRTATRILKVQPSDVSEAKSDGKSDDLSWLLGGEVDQVDQCSSSAAPPVAQAVAGTALDETIPSNIEQNMVLLGAGMFYKHAPVELVQEAHSMRARPDAPRTSNLE